MNDIKNKIESSKNNFLDNSQNTNVNSWNMVEEENRNTHYFNEINYQKNITNIIKIKTNDNREFQYKPKFQDNNTIKDLKKLYFKDEYYNIKKTIKVIGNGQILNDNLKMTDKKFIMIKNLWIIINDNMGKVQNTSKIKVEKNQDENLIEMGFDYFIENGIDNDEITLKRLIFHAKIILKCNSELITNDYLLNSEQSYILNNKLFLKKPKLILEENFSNEKKSRFYKISFIYKIILFLIVFILSTLILYYLKLLSLIFIVIFRKKRYFIIKSSIIFSYILAIFLLYFIKEGNILYIYFIP